MVSNLDSNSEVDVQNIVGWFSANRKRMITFGRNNDGGERFVGRRDKRTKSKKVNQWDELRMMLLAFVVE